MATRLLILKCSNRKLGAAAAIPAIERYDGPLWQVLRSYMRRQPDRSQDIDIYVLSAAFGLIPASKTIPWYDQTMAPERADELRPATLGRFAELMHDGYESLCLGLSQRYLRALDGWGAFVPEGVHVVQTDGPQGAKLGQLRAWLDGEEYGAGRAAPERLAAPAQPRGEVTVAGVALRMTRNEVLEHIRDELACDSSGADGFRDWYVALDDRQIAPKWIVSRLIGRPTTSFDASAARRALLALGVDVERVG